MKKANIDICLFTAHAHRSASTSKSKIPGPNMKTILSFSNWTKVNIFKAYCFKEIQVNYQTDHSNHDMELLENITLILILLDILHQIIAIYKKKVSWLLYL